LHELPDQLATMRTLTKWAARIEHPGEAPAQHLQAIRDALPRDGFLVEVQRRSCREVAG